MNMLTIGFQQANKETAKHPPAKPFDTPIHREMLRRWRARYPHSIECEESADRYGSLDREIFYELAARLFAAIDLGYKVDSRPTLTSADGKHSSSRCIRFSTHQEKDVLANHETTVDIGLGCVHGSAFPRIDDEEEAETWYLHEEIRPFVGRELHVMDGNSSEDVDDNPNAYGNYISRLCKNRDRKFFIKVVISAKWGALQQFSFSQGVTPSEVNSAFWKRFEYSVMQFEDQKNCLLMSDQIDMRCEYRVLVIDGRPVSGAGNIPFYSGADVTGDRYDPRMLEYLRKNGPVISNEDLVQRYESYAEDVCATLRKKRPSLRNFSLDLHINASENIGIVELNSLSHSGAFANDPKRYVKAAIAYAHRLAVIS